MYKKVILIFLLAFSFMIAGCADVTSSKEKDIATETDQSEKQNETVKEKAASSGEGMLTVDYIDVGQGGATLLQYEDTNDQYTILYDTGDWLGSEVVPYLKSEHIKHIDIVIISHPHADHIGQLKSVMENFQVDEVWMSGNQANSDVFTKAMESVLNSGADYEEPRAGDVFEVGPLIMTALHPASLTGDLNADSLSFHIQFQDTAFVFTGDAYKKDETMMLNSNLPINATVLQLGHHGSNTSSGTDFVSQTDPEIAIYSAGSDNSYGHPHKEVVSLFAEKGIPLYGTDLYGTIRITTDGKTFRLSSEKEPDDSITDKVQDNQEETPDANDSETNHAKDEAACIDINTASAAELTGIKHIGDKRAQEIMEQRPYDSIDELSKVSGIGSKRLADIKLENIACTGGNK